MILAIYCAGGLGREVIEFARSINRWENIIFVDDVTNEKVISDANVFRFSEVEQFRGNLEFVIANGEPAVREVLYHKIKDAGYLFTSLISGGCNMLSNVQIGEGCIIYDCYLSVNVKVGDNVFIGGQVIVGHDVAIGSHTLVSGKAFLGGYVFIGMRCYIAPGTMIKDRIHVGENSILSLGSVILRHVRSQSIMIGNPAKCWGKNTENKVFGILE